MCAGAAVKNCDLCRGFFTYLASSIPYAVATTFVQHGHLAHLVSFHFLIRHNAFTLMSNNSSL